MRSLLYLLSLAAIGTVAAPVDAWQSPLPAEFKTKQFVALPSSHFTEVALPAQSLALALLEASPIVAIDANARPSPIPMGFSCPSDSDPYLVRSLQWNRSLSGYTIGLRDSALQVSHGSLGRSASISRAPLIVCLSTKPPQVFVEAYAAQ